MASLRKANRELSERLKNLERPVNQMLCLAYDMGHGADKGKSALEFDAPGLIRNFDDETPVLAETSFGASLSTSLTNAKLERMFNDPSATADSIEDTLFAANSNKTVAINVVTSQHNAPILPSYALLAEAVRSTREFLMTKFPGELPPVLMPYLESNKTSITRRTIPDKVSRCCFSCRVWLPTPRLRPLPLPVRLAVTPARCSAS